MSEQKSLVRKAQRKDTAELLHLIGALAAYEKLDPPDAAAQARLVEDAFGPKPRIDVLLVENAEGTPVGYAIILETYSSFLALPTLYLEDIFVLESARGIGAGLALFQQVVSEADRRGCGRVDFMVLKWNRLAQEFYHRLGAFHLEDWCPYRLEQAKFADVLAIHK